MSIFLLALGLVLAPPPSGPGAQAPNLHRTSAGLFMTWVEPTKTGQAVRIAELQGQHWGPATTVRASDKVLANWADTPTVMALAGGELVVSWPEISGPEKYAYDARTAVSTDGGRRWSKGTVLHGDGTPTEHGFVSMVPVKGTARAFWLDGRGMVEKGPMTLRTRLLDGPEQVVDDRTCSCCSTGAAVSSLGPIVVYRDRTEAEVRDIRLGFEGPKGWQNVPVATDAWTIEGCPVNGPIVRASGDRVAVAWFTGAPAPKVRIAFSKDGGRSFGGAVDVDAERPVGRVGLVLLEDQAVVSWISGVDAGTNLQVRRVGFDGKMGAPMKVARSDKARKSGFPRVVRDGDRLVFAWTDAGETTQVRAGSLPIAALPALGTTAAVSAKKKERLPELAMTDMSGMGSKLKAGAPILVNLWATWCGPCREELGMLAELAKAHPKLKVVALSIDSKLETVQAFAKTAPDARMLHWDTAHQAATTFGAYGIPASRLYDRHGVLLWRSEGVFEADEVAFQAALRKALSP